MQQKADTPKFTDDDVLQFAEKLQMLAGNPASDDINTTKAEDSETSHTEMKITPVKETIEISTTEYTGPSTPNKETTNNVGVKTKRMKWTPEICKEFIHDAETLPMKKVMEKWTISKKTRYYYMKNYAARLLEETK